MTIEELLEVEEIKTLRAKWSHYYDSGDVEKLADLFTEDGVCEFSEKYGGHWVGRDQIREMYYRYAPPEKPSYVSFHAATNVWINLLSADEAIGRWYLLDFHLKSADQNPVNLFGVYDDTYRKVDGAWKIHRAHLHFLWPDREAEGLGWPDQLK